MQSSRSSSETVEGSALTLEGVDNVESGDGLPAGVFGVGDGVTDHVLEEASEYGSGLLIDVRGDPLDTTSTRESADSGLGNSHDGVLGDLLVGPLGSVLATLSFSSDLCFSWHLFCIILISVI